MAAGAGGREAQWEPAESVSHRSRRDRRGKRAITGVRLRQGAPDAVPDAAVPDGSVTQFQPLVLVLSIVPMALIGIVAALLISGRPLGFVAILGILALMGMIA